KDAKGDIDEACNAVFGDLKLPEYTKPIVIDSKKTRLENYLEQFIVKQKDIAVKIGTDPASLSRIVKGTREIFAYQVYFFAKGQDKIPCEALNLLYGSKKKS